MLLIHCPYCAEERPELEFRNAGEAHVARSQNIAAESDADFEKFFFIRTNPKGLVYERWRHIHGCGRFFNAVRDSVTDRFFTTYKAGEKKPDPARFAKAAAVAEAFEDIYEKSDDAKPLSPSAPSKPDGPSKPERPAAANKSVPKKAPIRRTSKKPAGEGN